MYHVKTMNKISKIGLAQLDDRFEISDTMEHEDAILVRSAKLHDYDFPAELLCIARAGAGVNNIPLDRAADAGIVVFNTPGANANGVKELTIAALLLASRKISQGITWVKEQSAAGADISAVVEKGKSAYVGPEIMGKTLGVVGLGAIGVLVANAGVALGMSVTVAQTLGADGAMVRNIVLFGVLIYELVGPALTRIALTEAGDIQPKAEAVVSADD